MTITIDRYNARDYDEMTADPEREAEALQWPEALIRDSIPAGPDAEG